MQSNQQLVTKLSLQEICQKKPPLYVNILQDVYIG